MSATATKPTDRELLKINESAELLGLAEGENQTEPGTVLVHLIRPCVGKGRGRHVYEARMLQEHAEGHHFDDWPMFIDHQSPAAQRAAQGLPRSIRDAGGRVVRTWWDPTVEADRSKGFEQGAVVAEVKPVPWIRELVENDPKIANVSINTFATGVKPTKRGGKAAWIVEGFAPDGSADWVTKAGAGGKVVELLEAAIEEEGEDTDSSRDILEALTDDQFLEWVREARPELAESLTREPSTSGNEEVEMDKDEVTEAALEALSTDAGQAVLHSALAEVAETVVTETLKSVLPGAIGNVAQVIEESARAAASQEVRSERLATKAAKKIAEAKLPEKFEQASLRRFARVDLEDKVDEESGEVTESAEQQLDSLVEAEIKEQRELVGSVNPTAVRGNGGGSGEDGEVTEADQAQADDWQQPLQEAGIDYEAAYGLKVVPDAEDADAEKDKAAA